MKAVFLLLAVLLPAIHGFYLQPTYNHLPARVTGRSAPVYQSLSDFFHRLHLASKRCVNTFDEGCINGPVSGAGSDSDWLNNGNVPGKRCVNTFDESCANGDISGAAPDDSWLNGDNNPGRR